MPENNIDTLEIQIKSSSKNAANALDNLAKKLYTLNSAFKNINNGTMRNYAREVGRVTASIRALSRIKISIPDLGKLSTQLRNLTNVDFSKLSSSSASLTDFAKGIVSLNGINDIDTKKIKDLSGSIGKLNNLKIPDLSGISKNFQGLASINMDLSGIKNTMNALKRLSEAKIEKFNPIKIALIGNTLKSLSKVPDVSPTLNRFVSSMARLANAGGNISKSASGLAQLGRQIKKTITSLSQIKQVSESTNTFIQSISRLASAGSKTGQTADQLQRFARELYGFFNIMKGAPILSESTIRMTEALSRINSSSRGAVSSTNSLRMSFSNLTRILGKLGRGLKKLPNLFFNITSKTKEANKSINSFGKNVRNILGALGAYKGFQGITSGIKSAINLGSAITEVENVVDVSFGNMSQAAYDFAKTAREQFGLSELAAKQYSGTMMAMMKSSGIMQKDAAKMSIQMAGLAGDLASFYNIDTETAFSKIRAGLSGQVMPLRQLGISMTVANLNAYALAQGIGKTYAEMNQAEKTILRYNYLLSVTKDQQGDFARTSNTWANQIRILKESFSTLSATLGQSFIAILAPIVKGLNFIMSKLEQVAMAFRDFIYAITGYQPQGSQQGITDDFVGIEDDLGGITDGMEDIEESGGGATGAVEDLAKALSVLSFDELNQLSAASNSIPDFDGSGSGSGGGSGLGNGYDIIPDDYFDVQNQKNNKIVSNFFESLKKAVESKDWTLFGEIIGNGINSGIQKIHKMIKWDNVKDKVTEIVTAITTSFNSLINTIRFDEIGATIGDGVNTIINTINLLITKIDWKNIGRQFATSINSIFKTVDWEKIGEFLGNKIMMLWDVLYGFFANLEYDKIGISLAEGFTGIFQKINFQTIAETLVNALNGLTKILTNFTDNINKKEIAQKLSSAINYFISNVNWGDLAKALSDFIMKLLGTIQETINKIDWNKIGQSIGDFLDSIDWAGIFGAVASSIWKIISEAISGLWETTSGKILTTLGMIAGLFKGYQVIKSVSSLVTLICGEFNKIIPGISGIINTLGRTFQKIRPAISQVGGWIGKAFSSISTAVSKGASGIMSGISSIISALGPKGLLIAAVVAGVAALGTYIYQNWDEISKWLSDAWEGLCESAEKIFGDIAKVVSDAWNSVRDFTSKLWSDISGWISKKWDGLVDGAKELGKNVSDSISNAWKNLKVATSTTWGNIKNSLSTTWSNIRSSASNIFGRIKTTISTTWNNIKTGASTIWNNIKGFLSRTWQNISRTGNTVFSGLKNGITNIFQGIGRVASNIWGGIRNTISNFASSAVNAAVGAFSSLANSVWSIFDKIGNWAKNLWDGIRGIFSKKINVGYSTSRYSLTDSIQNDGLEIAGYANGGIIRSEIWSMNEQGNPEMIGKIGRGSKTAVANNAIITSAIENAVVRGLTQVLMSRSNTTDNTKNYINNTINIDGEAFARAITKAQRNIDRRRNPAFI